MAKLCTTIISALFVASCAIKAPPPAKEYIRPNDIVPQNFPIATNEPAAPFTWQDVFIDDNLKKTIEAALENNRNLRISAANIERAAAQLALANANRLPNIFANSSASASQTATNSGNNSSSQNYIANIGLSNYEIDLFGKLNAATAQASETLLAQKENAASLRIAIISQTALGWLAVASDYQALASARKTEQAWQHTLTLVNARRARGLSSNLDVASVRGQVSQIRADIIGIETRLNQNKAILFAIIGTQIPEEYYATELAPQKIIAYFPNSLNSSALYTRPDIAAAEHTLRAAAANIETARIAFFPKINITSNAGLATRDLANLFNGGAFAYNIAGALSAQIFDNGANQANYDIARANQSAAVSQYENAIIAAFSECWSALSVRAQIDARIAAQTALVGDAKQSLSLVEARFNAGLDSYLPLLAAQRTLYNAEQSQISLLYAKEANGVAIYKAIGADKTQ